MVKSETRKPSGKRPIVKSEDRPQSHRVYFIITAQLMLPGY